MQIIDYTEDKWKKDHPTGTIAFQHIAKGDPTSAENFMYILGRQDADFHMPRHRHNFDQIRLPLVGDMFGGASGYGFMSIEQRRQAWDELLQHGKFVGPHFHWADGRIEWGLNTIWQHVFGTKLKYPRSRYPTPVIIEPKNFNWLPVAGAAGVERKKLGSFSERGVWIEMVRMAEGERWTSTDPIAIRLLVVLAGEGTVGNTRVGQLSAIHVAPGEELRLQASADTLLFAIGLPPVQLPTIESEEYDLEEFSDDRSMADSETV